jgi:hypothetical protein
LVANAQITIVAVVELYDLELRPCVNVAVLRAPFLFPRLPRVNRNFRRELKIRFALMQTAKSLILVEDYVFDKRRRMFDQRYFIAIVIYFN